MTLGRRRGGGRRDRRATACRRSSRAGASGGGTRPRARRRPTVPAPLRARASKNEERRARRPGRRRPRPAAPPQARAPQTSDGGAAARRPRRAAARPPQAGTAPQTATPSAQAETAPQSSGRPGDHKRRRTAYRTRPPHTRCRRHVHLQSWESAGHSTTPHEKALRGPAPGRQQVAQVRPAAAGPVHPVAAGSARRVAAGSVHPVAAGSVHPVAAGSVHPVAAGSARPVAAGSVPPAAGSAARRPCLDRSDPDRPRSSRSRQGQCVPWLLARQPASLRLRASAARIASPPCLRRSRPYGVSVHAPRCALSTAAHCFKEDLAKAIRRRTLLPLAVEPGESVPAICSGVTPRSSMTASSTSWLVAEPPAASRACRTGSRQALWVGRGPAVIPEF